jgi:hypothetical protein
MRSGLASVTVARMVGGFRAARTLEGWSTAALALVVWCVVSAVFVIFQAATPVAGLVVVLLFRLRDVATAATVVILTGIATGVLIPAILLYAGAWSPRGAFAITAALVLAGVAGLRKAGVKDRR